MLSGINEQYLKNKQQKNNNEKKVTVELSVSLSSSRFGQIQNLAKDYMEENSQLIFIHNKVKYIKSFLTYTEYLNSVNIYKKYHEKQ